MKIIRKKVNLIVLLLISVTLLGGCVPTWYTKSQEEDSDSEIVFTTMWAAKKCFLIRNWTGVYLKIKMQKQKDLNLH